MNESLGKRFITVMDAMERENFDEITDIMAELVRDISLKAFPDESELEEVGDEVASSIFKICRDLVEPLSVNDLDKILMYVADDVEEILRELEGIVEIGGEEREYPRGFQMGDSGTVTDVEADVAFVLGPDSADGGDIKESTS